MTEVIKQMHEIKFIALAPENLDSIPSSSKTLGRSILYIKGQRYKKEEAGHLREGDQKRTALLEGARRALEQSPLGIGETYTVRLASYSLERHSNGVQG